jgi:hypothetical protein
MNNFERVYLGSTEIEKSMGLYWYSDQHGYLKDMALHFDVPLKVVCGITAVLSPGVSWQANVNMTYHILKFKGKVPASVKMPGYRANVKKALRIYKSKRVFPSLSGPKVTQFYLNLLNPFNDGAVTIDTFMLACYHNIPDRKEVGKYSNEKSIEFLKTEVRSLAVKYDLLPLQFQAIVWLAYHREVKSMGSYGSQLTLKIF